MASCEFAGGIKNVRGTISKTVFYVDGVKHTKRVVAKVTRTGKQKLYIRESGDFKRTTPVSEGELQRREKFRQATQAVSALTPEQLRAYAEAMHRSKGKYRGKKYVMLRGYIIARFFQNDLIK